MTAVAPPRPSRPADRHALAAASTAELVQAACARDGAAWEALVLRYRGMVCGVVASYRLSEADTADVVQNTWLRAFERLHTVHDPDRLGGWLATTARRECLAVLRRTSRETADGLGDGDIASAAPGPEAAVLAQDVRATVRRAVAELPLRRRAFVDALFAQPDARYSDVSRVLGLPVGSIGPTRARVLRVLRGNLARYDVDAGSIV